MRKILIAGGILAVIGVSVAAYIYNQPHRDIQSQSADYSYSVSTIVNEYLKDSESANEKYLDAEGESKILSVSGIVSSITKDYNNQKVILLKGKDDKAGVSATLTKETEKSANNITIGDKITVKGVIRSGASYDEDLESYENVILEKSKVISN